jgi:hypothetical protein
LQGDKLYYQIAASIGYYGAMDMGNFQRYAEAIGLLFVLAISFTVLWVDAMIARRRFALRELFAFVTWISIVCAVISYFLRRSQ